MDEAMVCAALAVLTDGPRYTAEEALQKVPNEAGLYAVHGDAPAFGDLAAGTAGRPLYVGKAERSLVGRDLRTHFATGRTGSSTLRRTLSALLREPLGLRAVPRNLARPDGSANYSLESSGDERLTEWMHARLRLSVWVRPEGIALDEVETAVLHALRPPLNLVKTGSRGDLRVKRARAAMAAEARAWQKHDGIDSRA
ncbi:GIY-YIG nuclease family protein [Streptomyces sp. NPDC088719]|uniref:GIY-YIG nuclease family protein n=1 Tax=Streptomyces sp. NPDC088719 TaxID=3365872 RepID=UPI0038131465